MQVQRDAKRRSKISIFFSSKEDKGGERIKGAFEF